MSSFWATGSNSLLSTYGGMSKVLAQTAPTVPAAMGLQQVSSSESDVKESRGCAAGEAAESSARRTQRQGGFVGKAAYGVERRLRRQALRAKRNAAEENGARQEQGDNAMDEPPSSSRRGRRELPSGGICSLGNVANATQSLFADLASLVGVPRGGCSRFCGSIGLVSRPAILPDRDRRSPKEASSRSDGRRSKRRTQPKGWESWDGDADLSDAANTGWISSRGAVRGVFR